MKKLMLLLAPVTIIMGLGAFKIEKDKTIELTFVDHIKAGLIEQDVFVEKVPGSGKVYRVVPQERDKYLKSPVFTSAEPHHHDPFNTEGCGPFNKGRTLKVTLEEWLKATGTATFACENGWGKIRASFENLMPNATYTLWHFFMSAPPTAPFNGTLDVPLGDRDGSQSVFTTDSKGRAKLDITFEHCLQLSNVQLMSGLAVAYHSDGKTYGGSPGPFGQVTHVQLFAMLPEADDPK